MLEFSSVTRNGIGQIAIDVTTPDGTYGLVGSTYNSLVFLVLSDGSQHLIDCAVRERCGVFSDDPVSFATAFFA